MSGEDRTGKDWDYAGDTPWWYPLREIANSKDAAIARAARSVMIGTQWTQARLRAAKVEGIESSRCQACDTGCEGTLAHRHKDCPAYHRIRNDTMSTDSQRKLRMEEAG